MTPEETALREGLRYKRLLELRFRRQQVIGGYIVDFYCAAAGLIIEVDGKVHLRRRACDHFRDACLLARGLEVYHVSNDRIVRELPLVLQEIALACRQRMARATVSSACYQEE